MGDRLARFTFRTLQDEVIAFTDAVRSARSILVIMPLAQGLMPLDQGLMPLDRGLTPPPQPVLDYLQRSFRTASITLITHEADLGLTRRLPKSTVVRILPSDITPLLLPRREFLERVLAKPFDLARGSQP